MYTHTHTHTHTNNQIYMVAGACQILRHRIILPYLYLEHIKKKSDLTEELVAEGIETA